MHSFLVFLHLPFPPLLFRVRFFMVVFCALIAWLGANDLDKFVAVVGSFACIPLTFIYPVSCLSLLVLLCVCLPFDGLSLTSDVVLATDALPSRLYESMAESRQCNVGYFWLDGHGVHHIIDSTEVDKRRTGEGDRILRRAVMGMQGANSRWAGI